MPHPPIIIPFIGKGETAKAGKTISAMHKTALRIAEQKPGTVIVISPHGNVFKDYVFMLGERVLKGGFDKFGSYDYRAEFNNDIDLLSDIINICSQNDFPAGMLDQQTRKKLGIADDLDHGALVPLYFISEEYNHFKLLHISIADLDKRILRRFGEYIRQAVDNSSKNVVIIASGDMSHYLSDDSPYGYRKEGPEFDKLLVELLRSNKFEEIFELPAHLCERAGQCGLKSIEIMAGVINGQNTSIEVLSYEGPFGIGYLVADVFAGKKSQDPYVELAKNTIRHYLKTKKKYDITDQIQDELLNQNSAVFVSLKKHGSLRGCIGTLEPNRENTAMEIIDNAISAAFRDPRFSPLRKDEFDELDVSVDVLSKPEKISSKDGLDPKRYGVIVSKGAKRGVLLPDLEGVDDIEHQLAIALSKAGISEDDDYLIQRFEVIRHK